MNNHFDAIRYELQVMREELRTRLFDHCMFEMSIDHEEHLKNSTFMHHVKEELQDVERALVKLDSGLYGICEQTGKQIPLDKLKVLPTARNIYDFYYQDHYEKKALPHMYYGGVSYTGTEHLL